MKKILIVVIGSLLAGSLSAQDIVKDTTIAVKDTLAKSAIPVDKQFDYLFKILDDKLFVIEANTLNDKSGSQQIVNSRTNFLRFDSTETIIQIADDSGIGPNGLSGTTIKGTISGWKLKKDVKHKSFSVWTNVLAPGGFFNIYITVNIDGNAMAIVSNMTSNNITFRGKIVSLSKSKVYIGHHI